MPLTIKLQSPAFDGSGGHGTEIALPVGQDTHQGSSMADILTLFSGQNKVFDLGQLREVIKLVGYITPQAAADAGFANPVHMRDFIRNTRVTWPAEALSTANWGDATLPVAERDAGTARAKGNMRLIFEKKASPRNVVVSITQGTQTLTSAALFTAADVGSDVVVPGAGTSGGNLSATITGFTSASIVTLNVQAGTTVAGVTSTIASLVNFFLYGTVGDFLFGPRAAASGQKRIPFAITFLVGSAVVN